MSRLSKSAEQELIQAGYRYALSLSNNTHDAEDLLQQACLRAYKSRGSLVGKAYFFAVVRHLFVDLCRRNQKIRQRSIDAIDHAQTSEIERRVELHDELEQLLRRLSPDEREVLFLNCVEGQTAEEIAKLTLRPRGTVLSLLSRAKKKLSATTNESIVRKS